MSSTQEEVPNPVTKAIEANQEAETALVQETPDVAKAQAWAAISANWLSLIDPRSPEVRRLSRGR
jgi:hypothetical protein